MSLFSSPLNASILTSFGCLLLIPFMVDSLAKGSLDVTYQHLFSCLLASNCKLNKKNSRIVFIPRKSVMIRRVIIQINFRLNQNLVLFRWVIEYIPLCYTYTINIVAERLLKYTYIDKVCKITAIILGNQYDNKFILLLL